MDEEEKEERGDADVSRFLMRDGGWYLNAFGVRMMKFAVGNDEGLCEYVRSRKVFSPSVLGPDFEFSPRMECDLTGVSFEDCLRFVSDYVRRNL